MKYLCFALIYVAFFMLIGFCVYVLKSGWVLLLLIFIPAIKYSDRKDREPTDIL